MHLAISICNPAWHKCRTMVKNYLSRSCYNASSNLQLQTGAFLCAALPMRFAIDRLQTRKAGAPHQIDQIDQHLLSVNSADFSALLRLRTFHFFTFFLKSSSCHSPVHILPTWSAKVFRGHQLFNILKCKSISRYSPVHFLPTTFPNRGPQPRKQRPYFGDPRGHIISRKNTRFCALNCYSSLLLDDDVVIMMWSTWWCECQPWPLSYTREFSNQTSFDK